MISSDLKDCLPAIELLLKMQNKKIRQDFLGDQYRKDPKIYKAIKEIVTNIVHRNIPLDEKTKIKLRRHKRQIIDLIHDNNKNRQRKLLIQSGGYLQYIIPTVLNVIASLLNNGSEKKGLQSGSNK